MDFRFNLDKAILLKEERNIDLEEVISLLQNNQVVKILDNPNYPHQVIFVLFYQEYALAVPCVKEGENEYFIKTAYPSRKLNKDLSLKEED